MIKLRNLVTAFALLFFILPAATSAAVAGADGARQFVDATGKQVLAILNSGNNKPSQQQQLRQLFSANVDIDWMSRFVLGRGWDQATDDQKKRYAQDYRQYLLVRYTSNFADYADSKYTITGVKSESNGQFTVDMQINTPQQGQQQTDAGYRVRADANGKFKIIDIIVEGVSLITTEREDFNSVINQKGMDALISDIEAKIKTENSRRVE